MNQQMKLLCLSNGHGEDAIALRIIRQLQQHPNCPQLAALPIVGEGRAYTSHGIPLIGQVKAMPSGGFIYMDGRQFARDLQGGLVQLTWTQLQTVQAWAREGGMQYWQWVTLCRCCLLGGVALPMPLWAQQSRSITCATSKGFCRVTLGLGNWKALGVLFTLPWERWLMSRPHCKAVFPRDTLTAETLAQWSIPAFDMGNPMMDGLEPAGIDLRNTGRKI